MKTETQITAGSFSLFMALANDAANWGGSPMVDITSQQRGNLTQLKTSGLIQTFTEGGITFASFTAAGVAMAAEYGIKW